MLVTVFIISMTSLLVSIAFFVRQPQPGEVTVSDIQELGTTVERLDDQLMQMGNGVLVQELNKSVSGLKTALELSSAIQEQHYQQHECYNIHSGRIGEDCKSYQRIGPDYRMWNSYHGYMCYQSQ